MSDHNNINLGPVLEAIVDQIKKASDEDARIAVEDERARNIRIAQEHGTDEVGIEKMRLGE